MKTPSITFTGTSSGKTSLSRNHSSFLIKTSSHNLLIDAGDGISKALLQQKIIFNEIHSILFTHYHADHFAGIAALITQMKLTGRTGRLTLFTHGNLIYNLESLLDSVYMFKETLGFELTISGFKFNEEAKVNNDLSFTAIQNSHICRKENLNHYPENIFISSSILLNIEGKNLFYTSDIGSKEDFSAFKISNVDYIITEASHIDHNDIYELFMNTNPSKLFITHYDDENELQLRRWRNSLKENKKEKIIICSDGLSFRL